jgi:hypothetical protein
MMNVDPQKYRVTAGTPDGGDIDLDAQPVIGQDGRKLTEADAEAYTVARSVGRPSLSGAGVRSPSVSFRIDQEQLRRAHALAAETGETVSELARRALAEFLDQPGHSGRGPVPRPPRRHRRPRRHSL